jgi:hypothetical protein
MAFQDVANYQSVGIFVAVTSATHTVSHAGRYITANYAGTVTIELPDPTRCPSRQLHVRTITANSLVSASSNVVPLGGGSAGTAILAATAGKWALLVSDGTSWQVMAGN